MLLARETARFLQRFGIAATQLRSLRTLLRTLLMPLESIIATGVKVFSTYGLETILWPPALCFLQRPIVSNLVYDCRVCTPNGGQPAIPQLDRGGTLCPEDSPPPMLMPFNTVWSDIKVRLQPGVIINTWSPAGRAHKWFRVDEVSDRGVKVAGADIKGSRGVPITDFEYLHEHWREYCDGELRPKEIKQWCRHLTYVGSVLHWYQQNCP